MAETRYTREHEWVRLEDDGTATIGITEHAQEALGDIVFIELPETGRTLVDGEACAVVESVKAASDVYAALGGTVAEVNEQIVEEPGLVNRDPEGEAWFFRIEPADDDGFAALMDREAYEALLETL